MEVIAAREFNTLYIILDLIWLGILATILIALKRHLALIVGLVMGLVYFIIDYGIFYHALGTRVVDGADPFLFLLWLSFSYGITNFAWIWLLLNRDGKAVEWSLLIISGYFAVALLSQGFGNDFSQISISRGTGSYHGVMALILAVGYIYLVLGNLRSGEASGPRVNLLWLLVIGMGVQFSWELALLISGIRPASITPLIVNSIIETNLGMPYIYLIHRAITKRYSEKLF
jgi:hypothetical protein